MRKRYWLAGIVLVLFLGGAALNNQLSAMGTQHSITKANFSQGKFHNDDAVPGTGLAKTLEIMWRFFTEKKVHTMPDTVLPVKSLSREQLLQLSDTELHLIKLGHSSVLLKVYGEFWLLDPVFAQRASPFTFVGPKRFHQAPISIQDLPDIHKVLISHNHYDHLDKTAIQQLNHKTQQFLVPLGVEGDLLKWGIDADKILSFDWWQELHTDKAMLAFTPTRHFSGRGLSDANNSLWGSWVIKSQYDSLFFSGDSGYFQGFKQIGQKYGPFDVTLIETGAYDSDWPDVHMTPEQSLQAHIDLQGRVMIPIHNGTFDLAFHAWYEPLERISQLASAEGIPLSTPIPGEVLSLLDAMQVQRWWQPLMPQSPLAPQF
ncbi:MBL fold metallo-hydrolase [Bowmanella denitrificans]|uniref:MBL fold metallo-hydrolase n=1 Tax=Bowmanella denitrificans TaxID=366582 RepID=UPI0031D2E7FE